jgi:putative transcriptional regulator
MGIIVNQPARVRNFPDLLVQLQVIAPQERISLPSRAEDIQVLSGGPVQTDRGFVLHTPDFFLDNSTLPIDGVSLRRSTFCAPSRRARPDRARLALAMRLGTQSPKKISVTMANCPMIPLLFDRPRDEYARAALDRR